MPRYQSFTALMQSTARAHSVAFQACLVGTLDEEVAEVQFGRKFKSTLSRG